MTSRTKPEIKEGRVASPARIDVNEAESYMSNIKVYGVKTPTIWFLKTKTNTNNDNKNSPINHLIFPKWMSGINIIINRRENMIAEK